MAVPLPQLTYLPVMRMPEPRDIPTLKDIAEADNLERHVRESHSGVFFLIVCITTDAKIAVRMKNTDEDLANVIIYKAKIVNTNAGGAIAPAWFGPALAAALQPLRDDIRTMKGDIQTMKGDIQTLKEESIKTGRLAAMAYNAKNGYGPESVYEVVSFQSGHNPTAPPYNLPALTSFEAIQDLNDRSLDSYLRNYYPGHANRRVVRDREERINLVASAIGLGKIKY